MKSVKSYFYKAQIVNIFIVAAMSNRLPKNFVFIFLMHFFKRIWVALDSFICIINLQMPILNRKNPDDIFLPSLHKQYLCYWLISFIYIEQVLLF